MTAEPTGDARLCGSLVRRRYIGTERYRAQQDPNRRVLARQIPLMDHVVSGAEPATEKLVAFEAGGKQ